MSIHLPRRSHPCLVLSLLAAWLPIEPHGTCYSTLNWQSKVIGLRQPRAEFDWSLYKFQLKRKKRSRVAQNELRFISIQISIENERKIGAGPALAKHARREIAKLAQRNKTDKYFQKKLKISKVLKYFEIFEIFENCKTFEIFWNILKFLKFLKVLKFLNFFEISKSLFFLRNSLKHTNKYKTLKKIKKSGVQKIAPTFQTFQKI